MGLEYMKEWANLHANKYIFGLADNSSPHQPALKFNCS